MDKAVIQEYLNEVPLEVRLAIKPLSNDKSWAIFIALLKEGDMRFNDIKRKFGAESSGEVDRVLKSLLASGLIQKRSRTISEVIDSQKSVYSATELGDSVVLSLYNAVMPTYQSKRKRVMHPVGLDQPRLQHFHLIEPSLEISWKDSEPEGPQIWRG